MSYTRTLTTVVATLVLISSMAAPAAAAPWDGPTDYVDQVTHGADGVPSWHVHYESGEFSTLESWADSSEDREIITTHNASNYALVQAPTDAAGVATLPKLLGNTLAEKGYVTAIRPNYRHSLADPIRLENASAVDEYGLFERAVALRTDFRGELPRDGVAFAEDANRSTNAEAQAVMSVDSVSPKGAGATVAVIDSGVNTADGQILGNGSVGSEPRIHNASKDFISNETVEADGLDAVEDPNGHGSFVASQIAANTSNASYDGIAPNADILALRALDEDGSGSTADIAQAVRYAADHDADVIVMSLGSPVYDAELTSALEYAADDVSAIAIATGNSRQTTRFVATPADVPVEGVTAVSATNTKPNTSASSAYFANTGPDPGASDFSGGATAGQSVDVSAPGMKIEAQVARTSGTVANQTKSGTSMAAPQVAGIAALGVSNNEPWVGDSSAFNEQVRDTARPIPNASMAEVGHGMVAADRLLAGETSGSQEDAMDTDAERRDAFWQGLGGWEQLMTWGA